MNARLLKEFRPLVLAWVAGICASFGVLFTSWEIAIGASTIVFVGCMAAIAALPFGGEFQQHTMPLLLAQPVNRSRIWGEKVLLELTLMAVACLISLAIPAHGRSDRFIICGFLLATACSAPFWALIARSTIGGAVLSMAVQFIVAGCTVAAVDKFRPGFELTTSSPTDVAFIVIGIVSYSAFFLWLGWRKFCRLELKDIVFGEAGLPLLPAQTRWFAWLVCRPQGSLANLVRKEIRLQKPLFQIAAVVAVCWFVTLGILLLEPAWEDYCVGTFNVLTAIQVVLAAVLAGCISFGEENTLGVGTWHLTFPVSATRQWLVKLAVSALVALLVAIVLPGLWALITWLRVQVGVIDLLSEMHRPGSFYGLALYTVVPFVVSFWAGTLLRNTVRAALMTVIGLPVLFGCATLAVWLAHLGGGVETRLLIRLVARLQQSPDMFGQFLWTIVFWASCAVGIAAMVTLLRQSLARFRRAHTPPALIVRYSAILAVLIFMGSLWLTDLATSADGMRHSPLQNEVYQAIHRLMQGRLKLPENHPVTVSLSQLADTGELSETAKTWLRNANVLIWPGAVSRLPRDQKTFRLYRILIEFPKGSEYDCGTFSAPVDVKPNPPTTNSPENSH